MIDREQAATLLGCQPLHISLSVRTGGSCCKIMHSQVQLQLIDYAASKLSLPAGGSLVLQLSDCMTMFTANVVYLMARSFESSAVLKPFTSCICSPERFLICRGKTGDSLSTISHLHKVCLAAPMTCL